MQRIYILDQDQRFAARLGHALAGLCPEHHFLSVGSPEEMSAFCREIGQSAHALIYTASQFPNWQPDPALRVLYLRDKPNLKDLYGHELSSELADTAGLYLDEASGENVDAMTFASVYRYAGASQILSSLGTVLDESPVEEDEPGLRTCLLHAPCPGRAAQRVWERLLATELDKGRRVVGLPLTPPHLFRGPSLLHASAPADRADLASLLMRLAYDELTASDIMPYFVPTRQGCLAIAPCSGADDINEVKPEVLTRLLNLTRLALQNSAEDTTLFIFTGGLASSRIRKLLPLCDEFVTVCDPEGVNTDSWTAILNTMLSDLPAGRRHIELWEDNLYGS